MTDSDLICLDKKYSTTRLVTQEKPFIGSQADDKFQSVLFLPKGEERKGEGGLRVQGYYKQTLKDKPLITIITVVFNGEQYLEQTMLSVINQSYDNVEYIVIDGRSTDGTLDIIKQYEEQIDYWVSERDEGIYDAMNKALLVSTGDIIAFLNSDDWYNLNILHYVSNNIEKDYIACCIHLISQGGVKTVFRAKDINRIKINKINGMPFPHPGLFVHSHVFKDIGRFNLEYKIVADMDFVYRMLNTKYIGFISSEVAANFRVGGISSNVKTIIESSKVEYKAGISLIQIIYSFTLRLSGMFFKKLGIFYYLVSIIHSVRIMLKRVIK